MNTRNKISVIIPAHNESTVIGQTLCSLLADAEPGEFEIIVACNGCDDDTAGVVRLNCDHALVIEISEASKTAALNAGIQHASHDRVILLDADINLATASARKLAHSTAITGTDAAIGRMIVDLESASRTVRSFYRVWLEHPYLSKGKFAAAIALSREALERVHPLPQVIADDTYLKRSIPQNRITTVGDVHFIAKAPRTTKSLISVRSRVHRGNRQLSRLSAASPQATSDSLGLLQAIIKTPALWLHFPAYIYVELSSRARAMLKTAPIWERDLTTRSTSVGR